MNHAPNTKEALRARRHNRVRAKITGTAARPRLAVHKSNRFISAQLIDDAAGKTIASAHGREFPGTQSVQAKAVGEAIAAKAKAAGIASALFDRGGYRYTGHVKAVADAARAGGLAF